MTDKYYNFAKMIVKNIGGSENINAVRHCATRLRFNLRDEKKVKRLTLEETEGIIAVLSEDGQFQIVIGAPVVDVYNKICELRDLNFNENVVEEKVENNKKGFLSGILSKATELVSNKSEKEETINTDDNETIYSPLSGKVINLIDVEDEAFSSGALGHGLGIKPIEGKLFSPCDGEITALFPTGHAIGISSKKGAEILIHIGMDTVKLDGQGFSKKVDVGSVVKKGDLLIEFDINFIEKKGLSIVTPIIITNSDDYLDVVITDKKTVSVNDKIINLL